MYSLMSRRTRCVSSPNSCSVSALTSSVLPTPVGPRNRKEPSGRLRSVSPARERRTVRATFATASSWPTTRAVRRASSSRSLRRLVLHQALRRDAGPLRDQLGDVVLVDLLLEQRRVALHAAQLGAGVLQLFGQLAGLAVLQLAGARARSPRRSRILHLELQLLLLLLQRADVVDGLLLLLPARLARWPSSSLQLGDLVVDGLAPGHGRLVGLLLQRQASPSRAG